MLEDRSCTDVQIVCRTRVKGRTKSFASCVTLHSNRLINSLHSNVVCCATVEQRALRTLCNDLTSAAASLQSRESLLFGLRATVKRLIELSSSWFPPKFPIQRENTVQCAVVHYNAITMRCVQHNRSIVHNAQCQSTERW